MAEPALVLFQEVQSFRLRYAKYALAVPPAALVFIACRQLIWHHPWQTPPLSNGELLFQTVLLVLVYIRLLTVRLVTEVRPGSILVGLRGLWRKRRIPMDRVRSARVVDYDPVADFGGYGMRTGRRGQGYIARGSRGVELELRGGGNVLIGSQQPDRLAKAILESRAGASA